VTKVALKCINFQIFVKEKTPFVKRKILLINKKGPHYTMTLFSPVSISHGLTFIFLKAQEGAHHDFLIFYPVLLSYFQYDN
jgi:hypothetical protein